MRHYRFLRVLQRKLRALISFDHVILAMQKRIERLRGENKDLLEEVDVLRRHVKYDALTDILSRVGFAHEWERFSSEIARRHWQSGALLFIDLDGFKHVNDYIGHSEGDRVLRLVAKAIEHELRPADSVARIGGDEFAVLLPGVSLIGTSHVIERLHRAIKLIGMEHPGFLKIANLLGRGHAIDFSVGMFFLEFGFHPPTLGEALVLAEANMPKMAKRRHLFEVHAQNPQASVRSPA